MRSGSDYLKSLNDGRQVFVDGEKVADVTKHPAFREAARSVARLYDIAAAPENRELMTFTSPTTGEPVHARLSDPENACRPARAAAVLRDLGGGDLRADGPLARTMWPASLPATRRCPSVFATAGQKFADNVVSFYESARDQHLYVSYAIVPPQIDRSKPAHKQSDPTLHAGVVKERDDGIVIAGAQQVATGGVVLRLTPAELHPSARSPATRTTPIASRSRSTRRA